MEKARINAKLREYIPIAATDERVLSLRFIGEYEEKDVQRLASKGVRFTLRDAQQPVHAECPRYVGFREAALGTLGGAFFDTACGF